jgi:hypothetical protein
MLIQYPVHGEGRESPTRCGLLIQSLQKLIRDRDSLNIFQSKNIVDEVKSQKK